MREGVGEGYQARREWRRLQAWNSHGIAQVPIGCAAGSMLRFDYERTVSCMRRTAVWATVGKEDKGHDTCQWQYTWHRVAELGSQAPGPLGEVRATRRVGGCMGCVTLLSELDRMCATRVPIGCVVARANGQRKERRHEWLLWVCEDCLRIVWTFEPCEEHGRHQTRAIGRGYVAFSLAESRRVKRGCVDGVSALLFPCELKSSPPFASLSLIPFVAFFFFFHTSHFLHTLHTVIGLHSHTGPPTHPSLMQENPCSHCSRLHTLRFCHGRLSTRSESRTGPRSRPRTGAGTRIDSVAR